MTIDAKVILHSQNQDGVELVTMELRYPRFIHSEFMTYRLFSRNAASSRAIPAAKYREAVKADPVLPVWWGKNQAGMQAREELSTEPGKKERGVVYLKDQPPSPRDQARRLWLHALTRALISHEEMEALGLHKQIANRILEPWAHITVIATANRSAYEHLFFERCHEDAQPEFQALAHLMRSALLSSTPQVLRPGEWHLPYIQPDETTRDNTADVLRRVSVARCARVSYLTHDGQRDMSEDLALFERLVPKLTERRPGHWSPLEHVAEAMSGTQPSGNFIGFRQYRKCYSSEFGRMR